MNPSDRAEQINDWTQDVMVLVGMEHLRSMPREELPKWLAPRITTVLKAKGGQPDDVNRVLDEILGLGPLEPLLRDKANREIRIGGPGAIEVVRDGVAVPAPSAFADEAHLQRVFGRIFRAVSVDPSQGPVQTTMMDGSTLSAELVDGKLTATIVRPG